MSSLRLVPFRLDGVHYCVEISDISGLDRDPVTGRPMAGFPDGGTAVIDRVEPLIEVGPDRVLPFPPWIRAAMPSLLARIVWEHRRPLLVSHSWFTGGKPKIPPSVQPLLERGLETTLAAAHQSAPRALAFDLDCPSAPADFRCAISLAQVYEVVDAAELGRIPNAPARIAGSIGWRGQAVPAVDLGVALGFGASKACPKAVVARGLRDPQPVALLAAAAHQGAPPCRSCEPPAEMDPESALAVFRSGSGWIAVPDIDRLKAA